MKQYKVTIHTVRVLDGADLMAYVQHLRQIMPTLDVQAFIRSGEATVTDTVESGLVTTTYRIQQL